MIVNHHFRVRHPEDASKTLGCLVSEWESYEWHLNAHRIPESKPQTRFPSRFTRSVVNRFAPTVNQTLQTVRRHHQSTGQDPVKKLIDILYTQTFATDQIEKTREYAYTKNFRRHGSTHFQRNCDLTGCHPFLCPPL